MDVLITEKPHTSHEVAGPTTRGYARYGKQAMVESRRCVAA